MQDLLRIQSRLSQASWIMSNTGIRSIASFACDWDCEGGSAQPVLVDPSFLQNQPQGSGLGKLLHGQCAEAVQRLPQVHTSYKASEHDASLPRRMQILPVLVSHQAINRSHFYSTVWMFESRHAPKDSENQQILATFFRLLQLCLVALWHTAQTGLSGSRI